MLGYSVQINETTEWLASPQVVKHKW